MSRPTDFQNLEVSKRGAHFLHLAFQGGRRAPLPLRQLRHCLQAFCDRASSACGRNQRSLTFWTKIKIFIIDAVGNVEVHHTIIIFRGIECTWPWGRLQLFRRSPHSRNTGSVSCNSCACCTVLSQNEENAGSDRNRWKALRDTSALFWQYFIKHA